MNTAVGIGIGIAYGTRVTGNYNPGFSLTASSIAETASLNAVVGTLVPSNLGILTVSSYAITADPDSKFDLDGDDLIIDAALDYETATSHSVTIRMTLSDASTVDRTFTISVINFLEVTLNDPLTIDNDTIVSLSASGTLVGAIDNKTSGSTLALIDSAGGRFALDGLDIEAGSVATNHGSATSHNITVRETHPDAVTVDTVLAITVEAITFSISFSGDVSIDTNSAGTVYWMITTSPTASAADIIAHTGAITDGYGTVDTVDGAASVELPALGDGDRYFHAVLCAAGTSTAISTTDVEQIQSAVSSAYSFLSATRTGDSGTAQTVAVDIGAAAADRYILVGVGVQNTDADPTVTVGGVSLSKLGGSDFTTKSPGVAFYGGLVTTGSGSQNVVVTWTSAAYEWKLQAVWKMTGLISTTHRQLVEGSSSPSSYSISVGAGEFMFFILNANSGVSGNLAAATEAPDREAAMSGGNGYSADWIIGSTNAAFNIPHIDVSGAVRRSAAITFA